VPEVPSEEMTDDDGEHMYEGGRRAYEPWHVNFQRDRHQWEVGMRIEIPEFHGVLQPEELLDWLATVEEVLEFKEFQTTVSATGGDAISRESDNMVATSKIIKDSRQAKDRVLGEDEKTYASHLFVVELSATYVPVASKSAARKQIGG
jgi:hypothetical protein